MLSAGESLSPRIGQLEAQELALGQVAAKAGEELRQLAAEYGYTRTAEVATRKEMTEIADALVTLAEAGGSDPAAAATFLAVAQRLGAARGSEAPADQAGRLGEVAASQGALTAAVARLHALAQARFGRLGDATFGAVIEAQERLKGETLALQKAIGAKPPDANLREDLGKVAVRQRALSGQLDQALLMLDQLAKDLAASEPLRAKSMTEQCAAVRSKAVGALIQAAAGSIADNRLSEALKQEQQVIDVLKGAQRAVDPDSSAQAVDAKSIQGLKELIARQKTVVDTIKALVGGSSDDAYVRASKDQDECHAVLGALLAQVKVPNLLMADQDMRNVIEALGKHDRLSARDAAQKALDHLMGGLTDDLDVKGRKATEVVAEDHELNREGVMEFRPKGYKAERGKAAAWSNEAWEVSLPPKDREVLDSEAREKFPKRFERHVSLYYQSLGAPPPAVEGGQ